MFQELIPVNTNTSPNISDSQQEYLENLKAAGQTLQHKMTSAELAGYIRIKKENIFKFLENKARSIIEGNGSVFYGGELRWVDKNSIQIKNDTTLYIYRCEEHIISPWSLLGIKLTDIDKLRRDSVITLTPLKDYIGLIPPIQLSKGITAVKSDLFDKVSVLEYEFVKKLPDPLLVGQIKGCDDLFFIAQWDDDILLDDLI